MTQRTLLVFALLSAFLEIHAAAQTTPLCAQPIAADNLQQSIHNGYRVTAVTSNRHAAQLVLRALANRASDTRVIISAYLLRKIER